MPFTKFTNLDFDQIKDSIKDYIRENSDFTDFDFEGSNFSILIDTLAYNTYITAFNSNMIVNESFLDSATVRENVVSLARNIGYIPQSRTAAKAQVTFSIEGLLDSNGKQTTKTLTLKAGLVATGDIQNTSYVFSTPEDITVNVDSFGVATFSNITIHQGTFLSSEFRYDGSLDQRFILENPFIDTSTVKVYVKRESNIDELGFQYDQVENILNLDETSRIYLIQEVQDEKYEIFFGDGLLGRKLGTNQDQDGDVITVNYIVSDGKEGNGVSRFLFSGTVQDDTDSTLILTTPPTITTNQASQNGAEIEKVDSIKYFAPRIYSSQNRAVTSSDYEALIKRVYPDTESVSVVGGEELDPPEYGTVTISIKPKNGSFVSDFNKKQILDNLRKYSVSGINQKIVDLKVLYVEIDTSIYYDHSKVSSAEFLKTRVTNTLNKYADSLDLNKFGGRFKYSKVQQIIDNSDMSITSNITKVRMRRDMQALLNQFAQYEVCFGNRFHISKKGYNIKSTGFTVFGEPDTVYLTDIPNDDGKTGVISVVKPLSDQDIRVVIKSAGTIDYEKGEILLNTINISSTLRANNIIEIQAVPESNDVIGLKELYLDFSISQSQINMIKDVISSGEEVSGSEFSKNYYTSSYLNGNLIRN
tara:strand:- start:5462 stop:7393 length:1932 start_codon:yes stop_codon:yes gene_type:complete